MERVDFVVERKAVKFGQVIQQLTQKSNIIQQSFRPHIKQMPEGVEYSFEQRQIVIGQVGLHVEHIPTQK